MTVYIGNFADLWSQDELEPCPPSIWSSQPFHKRIPLGVERLPVKSASSPLVPILGVFCVALFTVQIRVHRHSVPRLKLIHKVVRASPIPFGIPPQRY